MRVSYCSKYRSRCVSASNTPSVITLMMVLGLVLSPKRTLYPTASPRGVESSSAMRCATLRAAMRRGCVWPIIPITPRPSSRQILGICVVRTGFARSRRPDARQSPRRSAPRRGQTGRSGEGGARNPCARGDPRLGVRPARSMPRAFPHASPELRGRGATRPGVCADRSADTR